MILHLLKKLCAHRKERQFFDALVHNGLIVKWKREGDVIFIQPYQTPAQIKFDFSITKDAIHSKIEPDYNKLKPTTYCEPPLRGL